VKLTGYPAEGNTARERKRNGPTGRVRAASRKRAEAFFFLSRKKEEKPDSTHQRVGLNSY
jgi:hypothetical protein